MMPRRVYKLPGGVEPISAVYMDRPSDSTPAIPYINVLLLGQASLEKILRSHLQKYGCEVELSTELRSFEQHSNHVVARVVKTAGETETVEMVTCHWLVGTDGAKGIVRKELGLTFSGETRHNEHYILGDIEVQGLDAAYWHYWGDFSTKIGLLRPTEHVGLFGLIGGGNIDYEKVISSRDELIKFLREGTDRDDIQYGEVTWLSHFRPNIRVVNKFGDGRVFVAGDAAHVHSFTGGQGMNSSIQDSFNLAWKLTLVEKGLARPSLLSSYTEERLPVAVDMLKASTKLLNLLSTADRNHSDAAWRRGGTLKQLGVNCRWSSIVVDERTPYNADDKQALDAYGVEGGDVYGMGKGGDLRAGDRAPDAPGLVNIKVESGNEDTGNTTSLFRIFRPSHHTVLFFNVTGVQQLAPLLEGLSVFPSQGMRTVIVYPKDVSHPAVIENVDLVLIDRDGHAYEGYGISGKDSVVVIIRPDAVVGGIVFRLDGLKKYFEGVFSAVVH
ncbi:hypothetical protein AcV7_001865 [Taiwanofungus camphoratus]|nr:hypothetical protein AcV7_001865 [Antrodia cinnamomea]